VSNFRHLKRVLVQLEVHLKLHQQLLLFWFSLRWCKFFRRHPA